MSDEPPWPGPPPGALSLEDLALLGDRRTAALVHRSGAVVWWCTPRLDGGACFARLLDDQDGGAWRLAPDDGEATGWDYRPDTLVLRTHWRTPAGTGEVRDALLPQDDGGSSVLVREIHGTGGQLTLRTRLTPRFDYGVVVPWLRRVAERRWTLIGGDDALVVSADVDLTHIDGGLVGTIVVSEGDTVRLACSVVRPEDVDVRGGSACPPAAVADPGAALQQAETRWKRWNAQTRMPHGLDEQSERVVRRSALVLRALTYAPTGAIVAAATTSLPESPAGSRTWDYRYSWLRDSTFTVRVLGEVGHDDVADAFSRFLRRSSAGHARQLQVLYGIGGERRLSELELDGLSGWAGAQPIRVGNAAADQRQNDAFGEVVELLWRATRRGEPLDDDDLAFLRGIADLTAERAEQPDQGLWEWRGAPRHFVHSKASCWGALDRTIRLFRDAGRTPPPAWGAARDALRDAILRRGVDPDRGGFVQTLDGRDRDAATLLIPHTGLVAWDDPLMVATADAVAEDLAVEGPLLRRYRDADDLPGQEGAFVACGFWLAECLARQGRRDAAREWFGAGIACANDLGLFTEQIAPGHAQRLGNLPQGLSHLACLSAALALDPDQAA